MSDIEATGSNADGHEPFILVGDLRTMDPSRPKAEAMAVEAGRILAVGSKDEARAALPDASERQAPGHVVPGLIDSHVHTMMTGIERRRVDVTDAKSVAEVVERVGAHIAADDDDGWLLVTAHFNEADMAEGRRPTRADLDPVTKGRPVLLDQHVHDAIVNTEALRRAGIDASTPDPPGGRIEHDESGEPNGILIERPAADLVATLMPPITENDRELAMKEIQPIFHGYGITSTVEPGVTREELGTYQELSARGDLSLRTFAMPLFDTLIPYTEALDRIGGLGVHTRFGDERLRIGGVKAFLDGTGTFGTALLREPWPGGDGSTGVQVTSTEAFGAIVRFCAERHWSLGVHIVGGGALDLALDTFAEVNADFPIADLRFSLIHAYLWPSPENMAKARELGVLVAIQPGLMWRVASGLQKYFDLDRIADANPIRSWLDAGLTVAGGSDGPDFPIPPLFGMWHARTRLVRGLDEPVGPDQAVTAEEALAMYTTGSARYCFADRERGMLRPGMLADWSAFEVDPAGEDVEALRDAVAQQTGVGGIVVHEC